jgi:hypothetical protein
VKERNKLHPGDTLEVKRVIDLRIGDSVVIGDDILLFTGVHYLDYGPRIQVNLAKPGNTPELTQLTNVTFESVYSVVIVWLSSNVEIRHSGKSPEVDWESKTKS